MKCKFCGAEILPGKDKCDSCDKYQHEVKVDLSENTQEKKDMILSKRAILKRKKKIISIIFTIIFLAIVVCASGFFLIKYLENQYLFLGNWNCNKGSLILDIDDSTFKMNFDSSGYQEAEYAIDSKNDNKYDLNVSSVKKTINGGSFVDNSNTLFQIIFDSENHTKMTLINKTTDFEYTCYKKSS